MGYKRVSFFAKRERETVEFCWGKSASEWAQKKSHLMFIYLKGFFINYINHNRRVNYTHVLTNTLKIKAIIALLINWKI